MAQGQTVWLVTEQAINQQALRMLALRLLSPHVNSGLKISLHIRLCGYIHFMKYIAQLFKSLSDPTRIRIVWLLQAGGELCVCDLMEVLSLPQSTVSRHLANLRNAGLVDDRRKGIWMYYRLPEAMDNPGLEILGVLLSAVGNTAQADSDRQRLAKYLTTKNTDACLTKG
jgi:ArsR family transcriptional regulator